MKKILNYINGELLEPVGKTYLNNYKPSTGEVYSLLPDSDAQDVEQATAAAREAFPAWSMLPAEQRATYLMKIADGIDKRFEELALAETIDNGKPLWLSKKVDIPRAAANLRFYATASLHVASESHYMEGQALNYTLRRPVGIAGCISPWNLPLYLFTWKIAPALATGNCVVAKPSEITPMTAFLLSEICIEAGLPAGVLNIVHGLGNKVGAAITAHPDIPLISFTGGTATGKSIAAVAAPMFKKLSLELGGKNPTLVFADCDMEEALKTTLLAAFTNQGQICLCGSRILVERSIYKEFTEKLSEKARQLKVGNPLQEENKLGALVSEQHLQKVLSYIELAKQEGGKILCGGERIYPAGECAMGWYLQPTLIEGLPYNCRSNTEEIFGPVASIMPFDTEEEALLYANATEYGLAASVWTSNLKRAHRMAENIHAGIVWINCWLLRDLRTPFGGVKKSGVGREGGFEAFQFFTEPKNVCVKL